MAARLIRAGYPVQLVTSNPEITGVVKSQGLKVKTLHEEFVQPAEAHTSLDDLPEGERFDLSLLVMKANPVVEVARKTIAYLDPENGYLVTCQNGIVEDAVAKAVGAGRVVSAIIGWGGTMHGPGSYEKTGPGSIHIGELDGRLSDRVKLLGGVLKKVTPVVVSTNIRGALWSKLAINCIITTMGAVTGQNLGEMLVDRRIRQAFLIVYREVIDTAAALGIELERVAANPRLLYLPAGAGLLRRYFKDLLLQIMGRRYGRLRSSMLQSLQRGRPSEIDYLNGYVVQKAGEAGLQVPFNAALVKMVKAIEAGTRQIEKTNMDELTALL